jgi:hypothetical protein
MKDFFFFFFVFLITEHYFCIVLKSSYLLTPNPTSITAKDSHKLQFQHILNSDHQIKQLSMII